MNLLITAAWQQAADYICTIEQQGHAVSFLQYERDELSCDYEWVEGVVCNGLFLHHVIEKFTNLKLRNIINKVKNLMLECTHTKEFSAAISTFVMYEWPKYNALKELICKLGLWDEDFIALEADMSNIAMPE